MSQLKERSEPQLEEASDDQEPGPAEAITHWYRNLGPNADIASVPLINHMDAVATSVLGLLGEVPETLDERLTAALELTTDLKTVSNRLAIEGEHALPVLDLILELAERGETTPPPAILQPLLQLAGNAALGIRENPLTPPAVQLAAHAKFSNVQFELLRQQELHKGPLSDYSDRYIKLVRNEAKWFSEHTHDVGAGDLFENYIGCLTRYQAWVGEHDASLSVRHATIREDQPNPRDEGGTGHRFAHDVHVSSGATWAFLQCKWGLGSYEQTGKYDQFVDFIAETTESGHLKHNGEFKAAFSAIAHSNNPDYADTCDQDAGRYGLEAILASVDKQVVAQAVTKSVLKHSAQLK